MSSQSPQGGYSANDPYAEPYAEPREQRAALDAPVDHELRAESPVVRVPPRPQDFACADRAGRFRDRPVADARHLDHVFSCLSDGGAVYLVNQSASAWLKDIASEVTVQVEPREGIDIERQVKDVVAFLGREPGIRSVKPLSLEASAALIEPWLGKSDALKSLPVPRLIAIEVDRSAPPGFDALRQRLTTQFKGAMLDDHRQWQQQIRTVTRSLALGGLAILMLVGAATTAIIISATRSALASNREIVEVLHFVGATDRFIAREFEKHFLRLGVRAGVVGAGFAMLVFFLMPWVMELLGGGAVTMAELQRLIGVGGIDLAGYLVLIVVVTVIAALCMLTSRFGVYRILNSQH